MNNSTKYPQFPETPIGERIGLYCLYCIIFVIGTSGNVMVIYIIGIKHRVERSCDVHIVSLAIADLLSSVFIPLVMIHDTYTNYSSWYLLGTFGCKVFLPMNHLTILVSSLMLITISLNRIHVIYSNLTITRRFWRSIIEVMVVWFVAILLVSPYMYHLTIIQTHLGELCFDIWKPKVKFVYFAIVQTISCFAAVIIMVVVYSLSAIRIYRHAIPGDDKSAERRRIKQNRNITKMFGRIVLVFFTLTTPYAVFFFIQAFMGTFQPKVYIEYKEAFYNASLVLYAVSALNCCVNPIIYAKMHRNMKKTFSQRISLIFSRKSLAKEYSSYHKTRTATTTTTAHSVRSTKSSFYETKSPSTSRPVSTTTNSTYLAPPDAKNLFPPAVCNNAILGTAVDHLALK